jgi:N-acetyl-anhydromuramyl-L-alanine amidase AmpD
MKYVPAKWQKARRAGAKIELIVLHSMEGGETKATAEACAAMFARGTRQASAHYCCDNDSIVESVHEDRYAYGAGGGVSRGRRINDSAIHIEHAGTARQSVAEWEDDYSQAMLFWSAILCAQICKRHGIHSVIRDVADLRAGQWNGITTHAMVEKAFPSTGHWDPGPHFPLNTYRDAVAYWIAQP